MKLLRGLLMLAIASTLGANPPAQADEGMWVFNNLPTELLKKKYGFEPSDAWIKHLQLSAVRFNSGGSGSFVSPDGLVMTNHHVGADTLQKISTKERNYYKTGFHARSRAEEVKAPDLELNVVVNIEDVTEQVTSRVTPEMSDADAETARRKAIAEIEKAATDRNKLRNDVVKLYQGGQYHLYTYKVYTDVRMVFAPEFDIAFFGGDPDNFEYPRYCLDVCFFRAYENDQPAKVEHYLRWSPHGSQNGDLVFVAGNPGRTSRLNTLAHLEYLRDTAFPLQLDFLANKEAFLQKYSERGEEQARQAKEYLFGIQNSLKARRGGLGGLKDPAFMTRKQAGERALRERLSADADRGKVYGPAWDRIAGAEKKAAEILKPYNFIERGLAFDTELFSIARVLVRLAQEDAKPNSDRLREYQEAGRRSLELMLYSSAPVYPEFETAKLANSLEYWKTIMPDD
ncbi:MAG TPA: S46 family peptidase, partial [Isosphaeraceae bacterium]|nr:S46 family peptidase [Isosphaeraceae bacterium]